MRNYRITAPCKMCGRIFLQRQPSNAYCSVTCFHDSFKGIERLTRLFWSRVDKRGPDDCWPWIGNLNHAGYGRLKVRSIRPNHLFAHRVAWELATGQAIPDGLVIMHACDNPPCCNPAHLSPGTDADNLLDAYTKGRIKQGEATHTAKLAESDVIEILRLCEFGTPQSEIAERFGVSQSAVSLIHLRKNWKHVDYQVLGSPSVSPST